MRGGSRFFGKREQGKRLPAGACSRDYPCETGHLRYSRYRTPSGTGSQCDYTPNTGQYAREKCQFGSFGDCSSALEEESPVKVFWGLGEEESLPEFLFLRSLFLVRAPIPATIPASRARAGRWEISHTKRSVRLVITRSRLRTKPFWIRVPMESGAVGVNTPTSCMLICTVL